MSTLNSRHIDSLLPPESFRDSSEGVSAIESNMYPLVSVFPVSEFFFI